MTQGGRDVLAGALGRKIHQLAQGGLPYARDVFCACCHKATGIGRQAASRQNSDERQPSLEVGSLTATTGDPPQPDDNVTLSKSTESLITWEKHQVTTLIDGLETRSCDALLHLNHSAIGDQVTGMRRRYAWKLTIVGHFVLAARCSLPNSRHLVLLPVTRKLCSSFQALLYSPLKHCSGAIVTLLDSDGPAPRSQRLSTLHRQSFFGFR